MRKENGEKKSFINIVDLLFWAFVLFIAAILISNVFKLFPILPKSTNNDINLNYVVTVTDMPETIASQIINGQTVYDVNTGKALGTVSSVVSTPYIIKGINQETGEIVANTVPERCNINVTISASAKVISNGYQVNGITIACGMEYEFRTSTVSLTGSCVSLKNQ